jgi:hypothetical protein
MRRAAFEDLSDRVWEFLRVAPFKPREETVTEGLLVAMHRSHQATTSIAKSTIVEEQAGGHDWLWALRSPDGRRWMHLRVQAKMLFANGAYNGLGTSKLTHTKSLEQVDALLDAKLEDQIPVYAFFNGEAGPFGSRGTTGVVLRCGRSPLTRESSSPGCGTSSMGVTLADADWVRFHLDRRPRPTRPRWRISADTINPAAMPWECLTCPDGASFCTPPRRSKYILGRARDAFLGISDDSLPIGVAEEPQQWAALLRDSAPEAAWESLANRRREHLDLEEVSGPPPAYMLVTELAQDDGGSRDS